MGYNLGLDAQVWWFGWGGLRWRQFLKFFYQSLGGRTAPDVLLIHCGSNDLGKVKSIELATMMKKDLQHLHERFPRMKLIFSQLTQNTVCYPSRPKEKTTFLWIMFVVSASCLLLTFIELVYLGIGFVHDDRRRRWIWTLLDPWHFLP